ncbi:MAG: dihydrofolate reductase [Caulobacteraceae bacterium]|nr:dihydrofolate reductase [Caulobacteraceae bacterium]
MAKLVYGMNQSLDGYVDHEAFAPDPELFDHFIDGMRAVTASLYGRRIYEIMRYWEGDEPQWDAAERAFAEAWRETPKWVASRSLKTVGPHATLLAGDLAAAVQALKADLEGEIEVAGPDLAGQLGDLGLIDEYRIYLHPVVLGKGVPFFAGNPPPLRLVATETVSEDVVRLTYAPA